MPAELDLPHREEAAPLIVFCHGFKGFKEWAFFPYVAEALARAGFAVLRFNFSHTGVTDADGWVGRPDLFRQNTARIESEDLKLVLQAAADGKLPEGDRLDAGRIGLLGHSRGGASVFVYAASEPRVKAVATLASVAYPPRFSQTAEDEWRKEGVSWVENKRTGQRLPLGTAVLDSYLNDKSEIEDAVRALDKPLLILHGVKDASVPVEQAHMLNSWAGQAELQLLEDADHTFASVHPFAGPSAPLLRAVDLLVEFFQRCLKTGKR